MRSGEYFSHLLHFFSAAKSTELLPNSQEGSKRISSVHSSVNAANQSSGTVGFEEGEPENLGVFELYRQIYYIVRFLRNRVIPLDFSNPLLHASPTPILWVPPGGYQYLSSLRSSLFRFLSGKRESRQRQQKISFDSRAIDQ